MTPRPDSTVVVADGDLASRYAGRCPPCDSYREFTFRIPADVIIPDEENPVFGDERPSELLDAGEWMWLANRGAEVPAASGTIQPYSTAAAGTPTPLRRGSRADGAGLARQPGEVVARGAGHLT